MDSKKPNKIYFLNDTCLINSIKNNPALLKKIKGKFYEISKKIVCSEVDIIDYETCVSGLRSRLRVHDIIYDHVICVGQKGESLFSEIRDLINYKNVHVVSIKRKFINDSLDIFDWTFEMRNTDLKFLSNLDSGNVLFVDDIVYSGSTVEYLTEKTNQETGREVGTLTLLATESAENRLGPLVSGVTLPGGIWPIFDHDLWCFRDLIESDGVVCTSGTSKRFIDYDKIMKKYVFGNNFEIVRESIDEISGWINQ